jgi:hypothetical protein
MKSGIATVAKVVDNKEVVINKGKKDHINIGDIFIIYFVTDETIFDPETNEELGKYEEFKGEGKVVHLTDCTANIRSIDEKKVVKKPNFFYSLPFNNSIESFELVPFKNPKKGDKAKLKQF